jgi:predicted heme/steroid binding protein
MLHFAKHAPFSMTCLSSYGDGMRTPVHEQEFFLYQAEVPCIISRMSIPNRIVTDLELKRSTGERGTRKLIAYQGIVYDVTDCPKWRMDLHEQLHFPGQDLTSELPEAPHKDDVFSRPCVKIIGRLVSTAAP